MKTIAITGGKGGTGKTTITLKIAKQLLKQEKRISIVDADIETPNIYSFIGLGKVVDVLTQDYPSVNEQCISCGLCVEKCPNGALFLQDKIELIESMCEGCGLCKYVCPVNAIKMEKRVVGNIYVNKNGFQLITGLLNRNIEETGGLVQQLIRYSDKIDVDIRLIDTAAGIHCNVIKALSFADEIYVVVEPTPLGLHDFKIIKKLIKKMDKQMFIIINKYIDNKVSTNIENIAKKEHIPILFRLPYDEALNKAYARGKIWEYI